MNRLALCLLGAALLGAATGCDDRDDICLPAVPAGRITGHVLTGGLAGNAELLATRIVDGVASAYPVRTKPDDQGYYALDVPAGRYLLSLQFGGSAYHYDYAGATPGYGNVPPDTLTVDAAHSPIAIDFVLGGLTFGMGLSSALDGEEGEVILHRRGARELDMYERGYVRYGSATIQDGSLDLEIAGVLPGDYQVEIVLGRRYSMCDCGSDGEHLWLPGTRDREASPWCRVGADSVASLSCQVAAQPARLEGRVTGAWLAMGLSSAPALSIFTPDSVTVMGQRGLLADGRFAIDLHLPGPVKLCVTQYGIEQWIGGPDFDRATTYTLRLGETISGIELVQSGLRLSVTAPAGGTGTAVFRFYDPTDLRLLAIAGRSVESPGLIGIPNLWPGQFLVRVSPRAWDPVPLTGAVMVGGPEPQWRSQWFDRATAASAARIITIGAAGEIVPLDLTLELGGTISGTVAPDGGGPTYYYALLTTADAPTVLVYDFVTSSSNTFQIEGIPDGAYRVGIGPGGQSWLPPAPPPVGTVWYPGTTDWSQATTLAIENAGTLTGLTIAVP